MKSFSFFRHIIFPVLIFVFSFSVFSQTTVLNENFEGGTYVVTPGGVPAWSINNTLQVSGTNSYINTIALNDSSWVITDVMDFTGYNFVLLEFYHICKIEFFDAGEIFISTDNGTNWTKLTSTQYINLNGSQFSTSGDKFTATAYPTLWEASVPPAVPTNSWWMKEQFDLSSIAANQSQVRIKFRMKDGNGNGANLHAGWFLDDIKIIGSPNELIPPTISLIAPIPQDTLTGTGPFMVSATITDASGIDEALLIYTVNAVTDTIVMTNTTGDIYEGSIPSVPLNTHVDWYVSAFDNPPASNNTTTSTYWYYTKKAAAETIVGTEGLIPGNTLYSPIYRFSSTSTTTNASSVVVWTAAELNAAGIYPGMTITKLAWDKAGAGGTNANALSFTIYLANTANVPPLSTTTWQYVLDNFTMVYSNANHQVPAVSGWHEVTLTTPFVYTGGSLEMATNVTFAGPSPYATDKFDWKYSSGTETSIIARTGTTVITGATALNATIASYKYRPDTKFFIDATVYTLDAGITAITGPTGTQITSVPTPVYVTLKNFGSDTLTAVDIQYSVNGVPQGTFNWTGWLTEDMVAANINIGIATFADGNNELKVWTTNPNAGIDLNNNNDTSLVNLWACQSILSGTYTIDSSMVTGGTNFQSFDDAMMALTNCGVNGPVVFEVAADTFNTRLVFNGVFPGASSTNTITFRGTTGTMIQYTTTVSADRAAIYMNGAKYLRFDSLTVTIPNTSTYGWAFFMTNQTEYIEITNCTINVHSTSTLSDHSGIIASGSATSATTTGNSANNILIENNTINGGYYSISFNGASATPLTGIEILNNTLNNAYYYNVRNSYVNSSKIIGNFCDARTTGGTTLHYAIYVGYDYGNFDVNRNKIINAGTYGIYVISSTAPSGQSIIANNMIGGGFRAATPSGIYLSSGGNIGIYYNTVYVNIAGAGRSLYVVSGVTNLNIRNNSFGYYGGTTGYATNVQSTASVVAHNYNNYYSNGANFVYYGAARANLAALQAVNIPAGNDLNSYVGDPVFSSPLDLQPLGPQLDGKATPIAGITVDFFGNPRDPSTPDIGCVEYTPVAHDLGITNGELIRGLCLNNNDSLYLTISNIIGDTADFSIFPLQITWNVTGPVNTNGTITVSTGKLNPGADLILSDDGIDMSVPGTYTLNAFIEPSMLNFFTINDTLSPAFSIVVPAYTFNASPDSFTVMLPGETVDLSVTSNMFPSSSVFITEVCQYAGSSTGAPSGGWPSYLIADDYIEITGSPNTDISGYTLEIWSSSALAGAQILAPGTVLSPNGICIIATGQLGSSVPSPANFYYHSGHTATLSSTIPQGYVIKDTEGDIVDAVVYGNMTFPVAAGITPDIWTGTTPAVSSAGNRLEGPYTNDATNWINSGTSPQNPNILNNNVTPPAPASLSGFDWSLEGIITSVNNTDTVVGTWTVNGQYDYVATFTNTCGTFTDTVFITVNIPPYNLSVIDITSPDDELCHNGEDEFVTINITNTGIDTVFAFNASYTVDGGTPVNEVVTLTIPTYDTASFTFTTPLNFGLITSDTTFVLNTFVNISGDPYHDNDSLQITKTFRFVPDTPVVQDDYINYGYPAELIASSNSTIYWFPDSLSQASIHQGDTLNTPPLFVTTTYWAESSNSTLQNIGLPAALPTATSGTGTTNFGIVFDVFSPTLLKSVTVYPVSATSASGTVTIDIIDGTGTVLHTTTANVTGGPAGTPSPHVIQLDFNLQIGTNLKMRPAFTGISGLLFEPSASAPSGNYGYPFSIPGIITLNTSTLTAHPTNTPRNDLYYYFYNWEVGAPGCSSERVPVTAHVTLPQYEPSIVEVVNPLNEDCSSDANEVSIRFTNLGTDTIMSGLTASYQIDSGTPVTENVTITVAPGDTADYTFATTFDLNLTTGDTTITITAWVEHPGDWYQLNDTTSKSATLGFIAPLPLVENDTIPYATQATLTASSTYMLKWYDSPTSDVVIDTGAVYVTPILYANTPYYVGASEGTFVEDSLEISYAMGNGCGGGNMFNLTAIDGDIKITGMKILPNSSDAALPVSIYYKTGTYLGSELTPGNWTLLGTYTVNATIDVPVYFQCDDLILPNEQLMGIYVQYNANYTNVTSTTVVANSTLSFESGIGLCSPFGGTNNLRMFNGEFFYESVAGGCESDRAEVWAIIDTTSIPNLDAGVVSIDEPFDPANLQANDVKVTIQNYGSDTLTAVEIHWTVNGLAQTPYNWTGILATGETATDITIGSTTFLLGNNEIIAWTESPNGGTDLININDTAYYQLEAYEPLCGVYHIGGTNPDFTTFNEAVNGLQNWGISCPVTFIVEQGTYYEQVRLNDIPGTDATNTITFVGNGNAVLSYGPSVNAERYVLKLDSAKHMRFENLTIEAEANATYGWAVHLMNGCEDIQFTNCTLNTNTTASSTNYAGFVASGSATSATTGGNAVTDLLLDGNTINGGYYGIILYGLSASRMQDVEIINNTLKDQYYYSIYVLQLDQAKVNSNIVIGRTLPTTTTSSYGIYHSNIAPPFEINKNKITNVGAYGIYVTATSAIPTTIPSTISNNMIGGGFTSTASTATGLYITTVEKVNVWYNSINMNGITGRATYINSTATQTDFRNNSLAFTGTGAGYAHYSVGTTNYLAHDYNNYYSTGTNFVYYGAARADLTALQSVNAPAGNDLNSQVGNPFYYSPTDLHASTTQLWASGTPIIEISDDFDGDLRDPVAPAIGADEYTPASIDAAVVQGISPIAGCGLSNAEIITVRVKNLGLDTIFSMNVSYSINGGTPVSEVWSDTLVVGDVTDYAFTQTADLSAPGVYEIYFEVDLAGDGIAFNDTLTYTIKSGHDFYSSDYFMGFEVGEDYSQWTVLDLNSDARTWEPGYNSTTFAHTGSKSARFYNGSTNPGNDYLFSECFYLEAGTAYKIDFWYRAESATYAQNTDLVVATDPINTAVIDTLLQLQLFTNTTHQLATAIYTPTTSGIYYFGWYAYSPAANWYSYIDDINIRILAPLDAGAVSIDNVDAMEDGGSAINMQITIKNYGSSTLTSVPVSYTINGGIPVTETWTGSIAADEEDIYTFTTPFTVPDGDYTICVRTDLAGDGIPGNNEICENRYGLPVLSVPYFDDFESTNYWYIAGTNNQWQLGIPSATVIDSAYSPVNAWATLLNGNYNNNSNYYLYTPKFNFSNVNNMALGFWHWLDTENGVDGGKIQYSTNGGSTWLTLGVLNDPTGTNWYNTANIASAPGFSGSSAGWQYSEISLSAFDYFPLPVQFRFHFFSNASVTYNGWAVDDFTIYQPQIPNDAGVIAIEAPVGQSATGAQNQVTVRLKNFGTQTLTSIPVTYRLMTGAPPVNGTWTGSLAPDAETSFTFPTTFTGPFQSVYDLCSWTNLSGDTYDFNDTTCVTLNAGPANIDGGVISIISPSGFTWAGQNVTVTIRVKNHGLQTLNSVPVQFLIDGVPQTTELITTPLAPGAETDYTFVTTFTSPSADYQLCAKTAIAGDAITTNDQFCQGMIIGVEELSLDGIILMQNIPNPAADETTIGFTIPEAGQVVFTVTNILGETIYSESADYATGQHAILLNTRSMAAGLYYYSITFDQKQLTRKMVKE